MHLYHSSDSYPFNEVATYRYAEALGGNLN